MLRGRHFRAKVGGRHGANHPGWANHRPLRRLAVVVFWHSAHSYGIGESLLLAEIEHDLEVVIDADQFCQLARSRRTNLRRGPPASLLVRVSLAHKPPDQNHPNLYQAYGFR